MDRRRLKLQTLSSHSLSGGIFFAVFFLVVLSLSGCKEKEVIEPVETVRPVKLLVVQANQEEMTMSLPGKVRAARRSELSFKVSGPLEALPIEEGQVVKKGDLIAQILQRDFQTAVNEAKASEREAEQQYQRYKELYSRKQVSKADFDRYRAARDVSRARLEDTQNAYKDTTLVAPFDGVIAKRYVENFEKVQAKEPIAYLQLIDQLEILIDVPELVFAQLKNSKEKAEIFAEFDAVSDKQFKLEVKEFSTQADPATQTYQVVLVMDQPDEANILPGMTSKVTAVSGEDFGNSNQILVPATAVINDADQTNYVWRFDRESMSVAKAVVEIGSLEGTKNIVITSGLKDGEEIVIAGGSKLREGMKVRPWENQREGK